MGFYAGAGRHDAIEEILRVALAGGTLCITAPSGGGVSTIVAKAAMRLVDYATVIRIDSTETTTESELLASLMLGIAADPDNFLASLFELLQKQPLVVIVENAQHFNDDLITALAELQNYVTDNFAVIYAGHPDAQSRLYSLKNEISYIELPPLTLTEACEFIYLTREVNIDQGELHKLIGGATVWPHQLIALPLKRRNQNRFVFPRRHFILAAVLIGLIFLMWLVSGYTKHDDDDESIELPAPEKTTSKDAAEQATRQVKQVDIAQQETLAGSISKPTEAKQTSNEFRREAWLQQQQDVWFLQVSLAKDEQEAKRLSKDLGVQRSAYYRTTRHSNVVYLVLLGPFDELNKANQAIATLPKRLQDQGPFVRNIKSIKQEIS